MKPGDRREAFERARLYLVAPGDFPVDVLGAVIEAGVDLVQLRMKDAEAAEVIEVADQFQGVCEAARVPFVINDRPDIALALAADGVHLGQDDLAPIVAREILGPDVMIGRSTHSTDDVTRALEEHEHGLADYIAVGPVHQTPTKAGRPAVGLELVAHAAQHVTFPWFAIGGINISTLSNVVKTGGRRIVVVRAIVESDDPVRAASELSGELS
ncbi:MAG: thiamine phosphate synthase [Actinomycetota bacterium]